jgi:hypothetical protein
MGDSPATVEQNRSASWRSVTLTTGFQSLAMEEVARVGHSQPSIRLACSLNWRIGPTGPTSMKVVASAVVAVCPASQW